MITERTLKKWRKDALNLKGVAEYRDVDIKENINMLTGSVVEMQNRILRMTQELMDLHLLRIKR